MYNLLFSFLFPSFSIISTVLELFLSNSKTYFGLIFLGTGAGAAVGLEY